MMAKARRIGLAVYLLMLLPAALSARTWRVPSEIPTVPEAADSALSGDTILVAPGTYICLDNPDYDYRWAELRSGVALLAEEGPDSTEIVDLTTQYGNILITFEYTAGCVVSGFSFVKEAAPAGQYTAIVASRSSDWRIESCNFDHFFNGIAVSGVPTSSTTPSIRNCRFSRCAIGVSCHSVEPFGYPIIRSCTFVDNDWSIDCYDAAPYIVDNYIARSSRVGVHCSGCSPATLHRNTIVDGLQYGLWVRTEVFCEPCLLSTWVPHDGNSIYGNGWCDVCNDVDDERSVVEACFIYWGDECPDFENIICGPGRVHYIPWVDSTHTEMYNECPPQVIKPTTWGSIRALFR